LTRLHEQLHKESTPEEETLTLQMLSEEARQQLIRLLWLPRLSKYKRVYVCQGDRSWCARAKGARLAFRNPPECCGECDHFVWPEENESKCKSCSWKLYRSEYSLEKCTFKPSELHEVLGQLKLDKVEFSWTYELEKICTRRDFIVGYADIYYKVLWQAHCSLEIEPGWVWPDFSVDKGNVTVIVECKPELKTFQGVLRQIKTYMSLFEDKHPLGVIATYSEVPVSIQQVLRNENVYVLQVPKPNEKWKLIGES